MVCRRRGALVVVIAFVGRAVIGIVVLCICFCLAWSRLSSVQHLYNYAMDLVGSDISLALRPL